MSQNAQGKHGELLRFVRTQDYARYIAALLAPPAARMEVMGLVAFASEIGQVRQRVSEAMIGHIRLAWWREQIEALAEGKRMPPHFILDTLKDGLVSDRLPRALLETMLEAEHARLEDAVFGDAHAVASWAGQMGGTLSKLLALAQGNAANNAVAEAGTIWAMLACRNQLSPLLALEVWHMARDRYGKIITPSNGWDRPNRFLHQESQRLLKAKNRDKRENVLRFMAGRALLFDLLTKK